MFTLYYKVHCKIHCPRGQTGLMIQTKKINNPIPGHAFNPDQLLNCAHVELVLLCLALMSLIGNLSSPTELPLLILNSERRSSWKSLKGSCFSEMAALPHLAQTITQHSESLRSCSLPLCPLRLPRLSCCLRVYWVAAKQCGSPSAVLLNWHLLWKWKWSSRSRCSCRAINVHCTLTWHKDDSFYKIFSK